MMLIGRRRFAGLEVWQRNLVIVFIAQMVSAIGFSLIFPFLPLYVADLGTNTGLSLEFWAGMVFSAQAFTMMLVSPVWGALADRYGRKMMVQRAMFGASITILLMAFVRTSEELVLLRAIQGLIAGTVSAANALVAASAPRERTGFAMGLLQVALWSGVALGPLIGGVMADAFGFRMPFIITAVMLAIGGILVLVGVHEEFTPETRQANKSKSIVSEWGHVVHMPGVVQTYAVRFLTALSKSMVVPIMPLFVAMLMLNNFTGAYLIPQPDGVTSGLSAAAGSGISTITGLVVGISSLTATVSAVYLGRLGDRIGHRQILIFCALLATALYLPQAFVSDPWQIVVLQGLTGLAMGGLVASPSALLARYTDPGEEGAVYGIDNSVVAAARAIAPLVGAGIAVWLGLRMTFLSVSVLLIVVALVSAILLPRPDRSGPIFRPLRLPFTTREPKFHPSGD